MTKHKLISNKVAIIGLGYVGLPLALEIAKNSTYHVVGFDIDHKKISKYQKQHPQIEFSLNEDIIRDSEFIIIAVPTPVKENKLPDLNPLQSACATVKKQLQAGQKIIIESTINPGVCEEVIMPLLEETGLKGGKDFELSHCPERINPGDTKWNVSNIPRNIGSLTPEGNKIVADFYRSFLKAEINEVSGLKAAEASKVIENTFRDINIAYVNELAQSFDAMDIDLHEVLKAAANKPFGFMPHFPSCGVGGHCIPVDPYYLIERAKKSGFQHSFLEKAREVNESMPAYTVKLLEKKISEKKLNSTEITIALLGLSYKADIPDLRESPALKILEILNQKFSKVEIYDPYFPEQNTSSTLQEALKKADAIIIASKHQKFLEIDAKTLQQNQIKIVIDGQNCLNKEEITSKNITYKGIGR